MCRAKLGAFRYSIFSLNKLIFAFFTLFQGKKRHFFTKKIVDFHYNVGENGYLSRSNQQLD